MCVNDYRNSILFSANVLVVCIIRRNTRARMATASCVYMLVSGKRYAGKDTVADALARMLKGGCRSVARVSFASAVKADVAARHGLDLGRLMCDAAYKEQYRELLISHATSMRAADEDYWVRSAYATADRAAPSDIIVSDWRFPNEAQWLRNAGARVVTIRVMASDEARIARGWVPSAVDSDPSECLLDGSAFDYVIENNGDMGSLEREVGRIAAML